MPEFNDRRPKGQQPKKTPSPSAQQPLFHGQMETERFHFNAFGHSEEEVHAALNKGFQHHLKDYGTSIGEWRDRTGVKTPTEYYEPNVMQVRPGAAYRDGEELKARRKR